ncbi:hypothetical protein [Bacillus pseudomycoides]|uniref:hypothetical protein n=1 Tax=Bacillus pseudomycoides TaxID=64104 RepID=UPI000BF81F73|nr:hypothetical protein [Bacillus pseudomycoides]PGD26787.1 hypothetical protein COM32_12855 [Bacillus pseudomycoides]PHG24714.1 hypothetical protein COI47_07950 [Bacillus pseudomycoides]
MKQLTIDDVVGSFDYRATSTADKFLNRDTGIITYEVHFYDKEERQRIDWFDTNNEKEAWSAAVTDHGRGIQKIGIFKSKRSRAEIMELD